MDIKILYILGMWICTFEPIMVSYTCYPVKVGITCELDLVP